MYGWVPELYTNDTRPPELGDRWHPDYIGVSCEGRVSFIARHDVYFQFVLYSGINPNTTYTHSTTSSLKDERIMNAP